ncbi:MAG: HTH domain-containing protein [Desulfosarcina sp.]|nr:HTH domain-containing protein [Desulfosarcina sp.]
MVAFSNILPYRDLGFGNNQALETWSEIDFADDRDRCLFTVTVYRKGSEKGSEKASGKMSGKASGKASGKILAALKQDGNLTIPELASLIGVTERSIERNIKKLQEQGRPRRVGPARGGHWEIL